MISGVCNNMSQWGEYVKNSVTAPWDTDVSARHLARQNLCRLAVRIAIGAAYLFTNCLVVNHPYSVSLMMLTSGIISAISMPAVGLTGLGIAAISLPIGAVNLIREVNLVGLLILTGFGGAFLTMSICLINSKPFKEMENFAGIVPLLTDQLHQAWNYLDGTCQLQH